MLFQVSAATLGQIQSAIASMPSGTDASRLNRVYAALTLVMAAPEYIIQK